MSEFAMARLAQKWLGSPLMMDPAKAALIAQAYGPRVLGGGINVTVAGAAPDVEAGILSDRVQRWYDKHETFLEPVEGVALIEVEGTLVDKGAFIGQSSGETSYEGLRAAIENVRADSRIKAVAFEFDTPGGLVWGGYETAADIAALSAEKPTTAIITGMCCSAGYLLASPCGSIIAPPVGFVGSIGVIQMYVNALKNAEKQGFDVTVFSAGSNKADFHPMKEQREDFYEEQQAQAETLFQQFARAVSVYRPTLSYDDIIAQQSRTYVGQDAVDVGLADVIADPKQAFAEFCAMYGTADSA